MTRTLAILLALTLAGPALAFDVDADSQQAWFRDRLEPPARKPQVKSWARAAPSAPSKPKIDLRCKPIVSALGDSARSQEAARLESIKAWKAEVQWTYGSKFMDPDMTGAMEFQCGPSSVPFAGGRIENAIGKVLPIQSFTCKLFAAPCEATVSREYPGK